MVRVALQTTGEALLHTVPHSLQFPRMVNTLTDTQKHVPDTFAAHI